MKRILLITCAVIGLAPRLTVAKDNDVAIAVWGLTFKADTDDLRDSPALVIAARLIELGAKVRGYDPAVAPGKEE